ncbi:MAG: hypothetical protein GYB20_02625 [Oceanospirillales bacterium]|nr:hypothetical protein [Oceanospirillales bacterium]MBR9886586.1 hypothetical protein [Oceanospirillales bacterium]
MPRIETQGLSEDYRTATGSYDALDRGDVTSAELLNILRLVAPLTAPDGSDDCPPSVNTMLIKGHFSCFHGDGGIIRCLDSRQEKMTPEEALKIITREVSIEEFDISKGFKPRGNNIVRFGLFLVVAAVITAVIASV